MGALAPFSLKPDQTDALLCVYLFEKRLNGLDGMSREKGYPFSKGLLIPYLRDITQLAAKQAIYR